MDVVGVIQIVVVLVIALLLIRPTGRYLTGVYFKDYNRLDQFFEPVERGLYRVIGVDVAEDMGVWRYVLNLALVNTVTFGIMLVLLLSQSYLPLNPSHVPNMAIDQAFNAAASFTTNTDWQSYSGEVQLSYLSQMAGVTFLMFTAAASGMAVAAAFIRGFARVKKGAGFRAITGMGNFYFDFVRSLTRVLIPFALVMSLLLVTQGAPQTLGGPVAYTSVEGVNGTLYRGPVASLESIKHIGTNGGGFFGQNSAYPYENPNPITNILELLAMLLLPTAFIYTFGVMVGNSKEGWVLIGALAAIFIVLLSVGLVAESSNPALSAIAVNQTNGNLEGKEVRFGTEGSVIFTTETAATATGSVNSMLDSYTPLGSLVPLGLMMVNCVFGGVGVGLLNVLIYTILAVFIAGLMVGRSPQYLGRKIESREIKLTLLAFLIHPILILTFAAAGITFAASSVSNPGFHGFTEMLYAYTSAAANNGSAFAGLQANTPFLNYSLGVTMLLGRYITIPLMLLVSSSFMHKRIAPFDSGTFRTDQWIFGIILIGVIGILGALTFFPTLVLGPLGEALL